MKRKLMGLTMIALATAPLSANDAISLGNGQCVAAQAGVTSAEMPVFIRDVPGTDLDSGRAGSSIGAFSVMVRPNPISAISRDSDGKIEIFFRPAGVIEDVANLLHGEVRADESSTFYWQAGLDREEVPLRLEASAPGDLVAVMTIHFATPLPSGTRVDLVLDQDRSIIYNRAGTRGHSGRSAGLRLVNGCLEVQ